MIKGMLNFFSDKDPDLVCFCQAFSMFLANILGAAIWIMRFPCSALIITGPGIIAAIIYSQFNYRIMSFQSFLSGILTAIFMMFIIMTKQYYGLQIVFTFLFIYLLFSSSKTRYVISFSIVPCVLAFNMPGGAESAVERIVESILSSLLALVSVFIIRELFYETRVRRLLKKLITSIESGIDSKCSQDSNIDKLFFLCVKALNYEKYFFKYNRSFSEKFKPEMYKIMETYKRAKLADKNDNNSKIIFINEILEIKLALKEGKNIDKKVSALGE